MTCHVISIYTQPDIELLNSIDPTDGSLVQSNVLSSTNPEASLFLAKAKASESTSEYTDGENSAATLKSRQFVYKELISTEEDYIRDLMTIIDVSVVSH